MKSWALRWEYFRNASGSLEINRSNMADNFLKLGATQEAVSKFKSAEIAPPTGRVCVLTAQGQALDVAAEF